MYAMRRFHVSEEQRHVLSFLRLGILYWYDFIPDLPCERLPPLISTGKFVECPHTMDTLITAICMICKFWSCPFKLDKNIFGVYILGRATESFLYETFSHSLHLQEEWTLQR